MVGAALAAPTGALFEPTGGTGAASPSLHSCVIWSLQLWDEVVRVGAAAPWGAEPSAAPYVLCPPCSPQSCGTAEERSPERDGSHLPNGETEAWRWAFGEHNGVGFHPSPGLQPHLPGFVTNPEGFFPPGTSETISHLLLFLLWAGFQWRDRSVERMSDKSRADPAGILFPKSPSLRKHIPNTHPPAPCLTLGSF